jgi:hypothetical protein
MTSAVRVAPWLFAVVIVAGCATTEVTDRQMYTGDRLPRPGRIIVYDFAATRADLPRWSRAAERYSQQVDSPTTEAIEAGRQLGATVAAELVQKIQEMGLNAVRVGGQPAPQPPNDYVLIGYFESVDTGSRLERVVLGFGSGSADLTTTVEGYQMTPRGLRFLGSGDVQSEGGKAPGIAIPLAVAIATANPIGIAISSAAKIQGEVSGRTTIEGAGKRTAEKIAEELRLAFQRQGWI